VSSAWGIWLWRKKILAGYICLVYCLILASYLIPSVGFLGLSTLPFFNLYGVELGTFLTLLILLVITIYDAYQKVILHQKATVEAQLQAKASQSQRYWLTMLTHEIKTPLAIIQSSCQNIVLFDIDIPIQKRIDKIQRSALRIDTLVQRFLRNDEILSRLDHIQLTRIHLSKWLPEQLALFDESAQKRWHVKIQSELVILADENLLAIALNNLLINALKYSDEKHAIDINVQIHMRQRVEGILFSITDHSSQIDDEKRDYLFGRYQLSEYAGNGIGLWACREIARAHSGEVWLEKTSHFTGNTFTIWLPKKDEN
jgi:signal transduction histidine kinase